MSDQDSRVFFCLTFGEHCAFPYQPSLVARKRGRHDSRLVSCSDCGIPILSNSNAGPFLLPEGTLPTCRGGNIKHVVATVTEGDKYLIFVKAATGSSVESDRR